MREIPKDGVSHVLDISPELIAVPSDEAVVGHHASRLADQVHAGPAERLGHFRERHGKVLIRHGEQIQGVWVMDVVGYGVVRCGQREQSVCSWGRKTNTLTSWLQRDIFLAQYLLKPFSKESINFYVFSSLLFKLMIDNWHNKSSNGSSNHVFDEPKSYRQQTGRSVEK